MIKRTVWLLERKTRSIVFLFTTDIIGTTQELQFEPMQIITLREFSVYLMCRVQNAKWVLSKGRSEKQILLFCVLTATSWGLDDNFSLLTWERAYAVKDEEEETQSHVNRLKYKKCTLFLSQEAASHKESTPALKHLITLALWCLAAPTCKHLRGEQSS